MADGMIFQCFYDSDAAPPSEAHEILWPLPSGDPGAPAHVAPPVTMIPATVTWARGRRGDQRVMSQRQLAAYLVRSRSPLFLIIHL